MRNSNDRRRAVRSALLVSALATVVCAFSLRCVTGGTPTASGTPGGRDIRVEKARLVERSKEAQPQWAKLEPARLHEAEHALQFVELRTKLLNLPLGLKETQLQALEDSRLALAADAKEKLVKRGDAPASTAELERHVAAAAVEVHGRHAKLGDIYYEKLVAPALGGTEGEVEFFTVYVLVAFPKEHLVDLYEAVSRRLLSSGDAQLRKLGQTAADIAKSGEVSH